MPHTYNKIINFPFYNPKKKFRAKFVFYNSKGSLREIQNRANKEGG
jgi:hypothetical protein